VTLKRSNASANQAPGCHIVIYARDAGDGDLQSVENLLAARDRTPGGVAPLVISVLDVRPAAVEVEIAGSKLTVARRYQTSRLLESGEQKRDAGVDADEEWLGGKRSGAAVRAVFIKVAGVPIASLCGEDF